MGAICFQFPRRRLNRIRVRFDGIENRVDGVFQVVIDVTVLTPLTPVTDDVPGAAVQTAVLLFTGVVQFEDGPLTVTRVACLGIVWECRRDVGDGLVGPKAVRIGDSVLTVDAVRNRA